MRPARVPTDDRTLLPNSASLTMSDFLPTLYSDDSTEPIVSTFAHALMLSYFTPPFEMCATCATNSTPDECYSNDSGSAIASYTSGPSTDDDFAPKSTAIAMPELYPPPTATDYTMALPPND